MIVDVHLRLHLLQLSKLSVVFFPLRPSASKGPPVVTREAELQALYDIRIYL